MLRFLGNIGNYMILLLELGKGKPLLKPFLFKGRVGNGRVFRIGWLWFGLCIITNHDYMTYHDYIITNGVHKYNN